MTREEINLVAQPWRVSKTHQQARDQMKIIFIVMTLLHPLDTNIIRNSNSIIRNTG